MASQGALAAAAAQRQRERGPVIVMHTRPDWVWTLADKFRIDSNKSRGDTEKIAMVRQFLEFVQYLTHTYRQMGQPEDFADRIEQVLRSTFGFEKLRRQDSILANLSFVEMDIRDPLEALMKTHDIDVMVHLAYIVPPLHDPTTPLWQ